MKNYILTTISAFCLVLFVAGLPAQQHEDLLHILKQETKAFAAADFESWKSYWCHSENAYFSYVEKDEVFLENGWANMQTAFKDAMKGREKFKPNFRRENIKVDRQENMAFLTFDQYDQFGTDEEVHKKESRVMKKTEDGWKILSTEVVNITSFQ